MTDTDAATNPTAITITGEQRVGTRNRKPFGVLEVGAAACAACCVGPILGFLAAAGVFTVAGVALVGVIGLLVLVPATGWYLRRRRPASPRSKSLSPSTSATGRREAEAS